MNLAAYARFSSDNQRAESIDEQLREINQWALRHGHSIIASYTDSALSGKFDYRPSFEKMLKDAQSAVWEGVIVFDLSRFSRAGEYGIVDSLRLKEFGKCLLSVTEQFSDDFGGKLIKYVKMLNAEEFIEQLRVNVKRGHSQNAIHAQHNGGTPPLGYDVNHKTMQLVINEREAEAVRMIFTMFAAKKSYTEICLALNMEGFKTKRNYTRFQKNSLYEILGNKKYIGVYEYGKIITKITGRKKQYVPAAPETIVTIENGCPAIIDKALFHEVQIMRSKRLRVANPKAQVDYLLRGKVRCGRCGSAYVGSAMKSHDKKVYYYICSGKKNGKDCDNRNISKDVLENKVVEEIKKQYLSEAGIAWVNEKIKSFNDNVKPPVSDAEAEAFVKIIEQLENRIARQKEAFYNGIISIDELKCENELTQKTIDEHKNKLVTNHAKTLNEQSVANVIERYKNTLLTNADLIEALVESVIIDGEDITVNLFSTPFNPPPNKNGSSESSNNEGHGNKETPLTERAESLCDKDIGYVRSPPPITIRGEHCLLRTMYTMSLLKEYLV